MTTIFCRSYEQAEALRNYFSGLGVATGEFRSVESGHGIALPVEAGVTDPSVRAVAGENAHGELTARPYEHRPAAARRPEYPHE